MTTAAAHERPVEVERRLLRDAVVAERAAILERLACEVVALIRRRDALLLVHVGLHRLESGVRRNVPRPPGYVPLHVPVALAWSLL